jgi:hypothetical protein
MTLNEPRIRIELVLQTNVGFIRLLTYNGIDERVGIIQ